MSKNKKNITIFHLKNIIFTAVKYCSILHGPVFVMCLLSGERALAFELRDANQGITVMSYEEKKHISITGIDFYDLITARHAFRPRM